ncbi:MULTISPECIES: PaaI family thioesterase [Shouchella]|uniref:Thioesterase-related protein n=3 Tax=Bacillaceae TaxID=186817 RepID=A0A060LYQ8_9BACI|nr:MULTISPECIES: PaaI family thioesterase [Bacillaceae]RQW22976.1 PaaI family thioesterase [Bacillus sp. C1-1]AIC93418.1 thioesterase-related protein [Shouchella lehensis G1]KQL58405.1 thioesterase [Alkalicoccobacillus plakortidis]MBG9782845.1 thioesterase [Shouchella lehensis]TES49810.1 PaaI family thioesterase [Shouchella lehensis]
MSNPLMDVIHFKKEPPPCDTFTGVEIVEAHEGMAHAIWRPTEQMLNGNGVVMGGFVSSAADVAMAYAISSLMNDKQLFASVTLNVAFHRPALPGEIEVKAVVEKFGRTMSYVTANLYQNDKLVASAVSSVLVHEVND